MAPFYLDENMAESFAGLLHVQGHEVLTTNQAGNKGQSDVRQLLFATRTGRTLITHDARDYPMLHEVWYALGREWDVSVAIFHPGILILPVPRRLSVPEAAGVVEDVVDRVAVANWLLMWKIPTGWVDVP